MDLLPQCNCTQYRSGSVPCSICCFGGSRSSVDEPQPLLRVMGSFLEIEGNRVLDCVPKFIAGAISGTLTGLFALAGAFTGAVTGALASRASDCGILRGAGLGAIAGAVLSVEILEASRAYWCLEQSGSRGPSSMADFIDELLQGRFLDEQITPAMLSAYHWQLGIGDLNHEDVHDTYSEITSRGLSVDCLKNLPSHKLDSINTTQTICCTICLQDIEVGEVARCLPKCNHTFHLTCIDKWLVRHSSCPICRQNV